MTAPNIKVRNIGKQYRLGEVGSRSFKQDISRIFSKLKGNEDPTLGLGEENDRTIKGKSDYVWACKDINFDVYPGEVLGIIGKNGAGKSTLLKILSRVTGPTTGNIKVNGRIASLLEVGTGFHPDLTGRENIFLNGAILGMTKAEIRSKFDEIVDFSGVERYIDTPVKRYSSGMYVRLAFAVAAHLEPEILIVDEVLAVGDAEFQKKCLGKMKAVSGEGRTVLFVSHNIAAVKNLCSRAILLKNGNLILDDSVNNVVESYLAPSHQIISNTILPTDEATIKTGEAYFTSLSILNSLGQQTNEIAFGEIITIRAEIKVEKSINELLADVKFISRDGVVLTHSLNMFENFKISSISKGIYNLSVEIENRFQPGNYSLTMGLHHGNGMSIHILENILEIKILPVSRGDGAGYLLDWMYGYVRPKTTWNFE